jgi:hypothetical protein
MNYNPQKHNHLQGNGELSENTFLPQCDEIKVALCQNSHLKIQDKTEL